MNFEIPELKKTSKIPNGLIPFNFCKSRPDYNKSVHFFLDDYQFERIWRNPGRYCEMLLKFDGVLTPDFSLYRDMPLAMQLWNVHRSRQLGKWMQEEGMTVIPTVSWSDERSYEFCFDGLPPGGTVAISSVGICCDKKAKALFLDGVLAMLAHIHPEVVLFYGVNILAPEITKSVRIVEYPSFTQSQFASKRK